MGIYLFSFLGKAAAVALFASQIEDLCTTVNYTAVSCESNIDAVTIY